MRKLLQAFGMWIRRRKIARAVRLARSMDGMVVGRAVYLQAVELLGALANKLETSGILRGQPAKLRKIEALVAEVAAAFGDAVRLGDPALQLADIRDAYVRAKVRTLSKRQRDELQYVDAVRALTARGEAVGKASLAAASAAASNVLEGTTSVAG